MQNQVRKAYTWITFCMFLPWTLGMEWSLALLNPDKHDENQLIFKNMQCNVSCNFSSLTISLYIYMFQKLF